MKRYDPSRSPDPEEWLALDEGERQMLVEAYHRRARIRPPNRRLHAVFHVIVENQIVTVISYLSIQLPHSFFLKE